MGNDLKTVSITIAGRSFPIKVTTDEEILIRELESDINAEIVKLQQAYPMRDKLDYVIMAMLTYINDLKKNPKPSENEAISSKVDSILSMIDQF